LAPAKTCIPINFMIIKGDDKTKTAVR